MSPIGSAGCGWGNTRLTRTSVLPASRGGTTYKKRWDWDSRPSGGKLEERGEHPTFLPDGWVTQSRLEGESAYQARAKTVLPKASRRSWRKRYEAPTPVLKAGAFPEVWQRWVAYPIELWYMGFLNAWFSIAQTPLWKYKATGNSGSGGCEWQSLVQFSIFYLAINPHFSLVSPQGQHLGWAKWVSSVWRTLFTARVGSRGWRI